MSESMRLYKPYRGQGAATSLEISVKRDKNGYEDVSIFLTMVKEIPSTNDNAAFGWKDDSQCVKMKLGDPDCAELLAVIRGLKNEVGTGKGLFHKNSLGNSALNFSYNEEKKQFFLAGSSKRGNDLVKVSHTVTMGEALLIGILIEEFIKRKYDWNSAVAFEKPQ